MRTTVDIPDAIYLQLEMRADREGVSVEELILKGVADTFGGQDVSEDRFSGGEPPVIRAKHPGSLKLGPEGVYEYIPFP